MLTSIKKQVSYIHWLQIVNRERSNFVPFLTRTAVLMDESESVAQATPGTSSGTDSATIPPVLTEQDIPGAALNEPMDQHTMPWDSSDSFIEKEPAY